MPKKDSLLVLPKGKNWSKELNEAKEWNFKLKFKNEVTDKSGGVTLLINGLEKLNEDYFSIVNQKGVRD